MSVSTQQETLANVKTLQAFIGYPQLQAIAHGLRGEEKAFFKEKLAEYAERVATMPYTYQQDGLGKQAIAYLHYFNGSSDWYITEKDMSGDDEDGQCQAFGYVSLNGQDGELVYISIKELVAHGVELDLHFTPKTLAEVMP